MPRALPVWEPRRPRFTRPRPDPTAFVSPALCHSGSASGHLGPAPRTWAPGLPSQPGPPPPPPPPPRARSLRSRNPGPPRLGPCFLHFPEAACQWAVRQHLWLAACWLPHEEAWAVIREVGRSTDGGFYPCTLGGWGWGGEYY